MRQLGMRLLAVAVFASAAVLAGCGGGLDTHPVHGKVTYADGSPVTKGTVMFTGEHSAHGQIQPDGSYSLSTTKPGDGAAVGTYKVFITGAEEGGYPDPAVQLVEGKYTMPNTSGLTFDVKPGDNTYDIQVTKPGA